MRATQDGWKRQLQRERCGLSCGKSFLIRGHQTFARCPPESCDDTINPLCEGSKLGPLQSPQQPGAAAEGFLLSMCCPLSLPEPTTKSSAQSVHLMFDSGMGEVEGQLQPLL